MIKRKLLLGAMTLGMMTCIASIGKDAKAAEETVTVPSIVGNEQVIYLDSKDKISVSGKRIVSVKYSSSKKKVAVINKKGKITPKKKGKTTIRAKVVYRKKAGGKKYTKKLSYSLQVYGKAKEYFKYDKKSNYVVITGLKAKGERLSKVYLPEYIGSKKVEILDAEKFGLGSKMQELYFSDTIRGIDNDFSDKAMQLKKLSFGKAFGEDAYLSDVFKNCKNLEEIEVDERNECFEIKDNVLFEAKRLVFYPAKKSGSSYRIPDYVTEIQAYAFANCLNLKTISMPDSVTEFGRYCFTGSGLTSIYFSDEVERLSVGMFANCSLLKDVRLSKRMMSIPSRAFYNCKSLKSFTLESGIEYGEGDCFEGCEQLSEFIVSDAHKTLKAVDGVLYNMKEKRLVLYPSGRKDTSYTIADGTVTIGDEAFYAAKSLQKVVIPDSVNKIQEYAFCKSGLTEVTLPSSVTEMGRSAFDGCASLVSAKLPEYLTEIPTYTFADCKKLSTIVLPQEVSKVSEYAFDGCDSLTAIDVAPDNTKYTSLNGILYSRDKTILYKYPNGKKNVSFTVPNTVKDIEAYAFTSTQYLKNIIVPDEVQEFEYSAFEDCTSMETIDLPSKLSSDNVINFRNCTSLKSIVIPEGATVVEFAFNNCKSLESVKLPASLTKIRDYTFCNCTSLKEITIGAKIKKIGRSAFENCKSLTKITIKTKKLKKTNVEEAAFKKAGAKNYKKLVVKVPNGKKKAYKKLLQNVGLSKKATIK